MTFPSNEHLDEAIKYWEPRYGRKLTHEDAREIVMNLTGFFKILMEWDRRERAKAAEAKKVGEASRPGG